jgi:hypothetical protein
MRSLLAAVLPVAGLLTFGPWGCAPPAQIRYEDRLEDTTARAEHAVHSDRLEQVMGGLERLSDERLPKAMDLREERARRVKVVVKVARAMAKSARRIPAAIAGVDLDGEAREEFLRIAEELRRSALELAESAPRMSTAEMRAQADAIEATCEACHERFRAGPLTEGASNPPATTKDLVRPQTRSR